MEKNILIVGGCVAAKEAALAARKINPSCNITILSEENYYPYYRPMLSKCITENINEKRFYLASKEDYDKNNINLKLDEKATEFLPNEKIVKTAKKNIYSYDKLLIATGSKNFIPLPEAMNIPGVFSIRDYNDAKETKEWIASLTSETNTKDHPKAIVVGGGLLGLEAAWELKTSGVDVTIVELAPQVLVAQLDKEGADFLSDMIKSKGVNLILGKSVNKVCGKEKISSIYLNDGSTLPCDLLLFSVGARPNIELVKDSGIEINRGILVNSKMQTSIKDVYAAGDVAEIKGCASGIWRPALEQGKVAGTNMCGEDITYTNPPVPTFLNAFDTQVQSIGNIDCIDEADTKKYIDECKNIYKKLLFKDNIIVGGILIGDIKSSTKVLKAIQNKSKKQDIASILQ